LDNGVFHDRRNFRSLVGSVQRGSLGSLAASSAGATAKATLYS
jgi:hypothetical protein